MPGRIFITVDQIRLEARLNDTNSAQAVWDALPISAAANTWGGEIYFGIPATAELEHGQEVVELGDLGYWHPGRAFCIFFGLTPASAVTVIGKVQGDVAVLKQVRSGARVTLEAIPE